MWPVHWAAKLLTDTEVLSGFGVVSVGFGRFFSQNGEAA
jgi:hypothetical protein